MRSKFLLISWLLLTSTALSLSQPQLPTPAEINRYASYTTHAEISEFLSRVENVSANVTVKTIGETLEGDDLYLVICATDGKVDTNKATLFIFANQHGDEQSGKEAVLRFIRDFAVGELTPLLDKLNVLVVPLVNPHGARMDKRTNEQNLDLNRDHVKLESPEVRALHSVFLEWLPEVTLDVHENGEDYYLQQIGIVSNANISPGLQSFSLEQVLPYIEKGLAKIGVTFHEYLIRERINFDNISPAETGCDTSHIPQYLYRLSTTDINDGRNSFGIYNTLSFILEGASSGRVEGLEERTERQYWSIRLLAQFVAENADTVRKLVRQERKALMRDSGHVYLRMRYVPDPAAEPLILKEYVEADMPIKGVMKVDRKKGEIINLKDIQFEPMGERRIVERMIPDRRPKVEVTCSRTRPAAYVIPRDRLDIVQTLLDHGIAIDMLSHDHKLLVEAYKVLDVTPAEQDYFAPSMIKVEAKKTNQILPRGTFIVPVQGLHRNLIPILLEPLSSYGLIRYFNYKLVPQINDYYTIYRLDDLQGIELIPYFKKNKK